MAGLILEPDSGSDRVRVTLDGQRLVCLRDGDREGLKVITTWLVDSPSSASKKRQWSKG